MIESSAKSAPIEGKRTRRARRASLVVTGLVGAATLVAAAPSSVLALGMFDDAPGLAEQDIGAFTPASADPRVARIVAERSGGQAGFMQFTPAGSFEPGSRSVTVAVRVDQKNAEAISLRSMDGTVVARTADDEGLRIAPTRYNLGLSRGYQNFARPAPISGTLSKANIPDLSEFEPSAGVRDEPSRFAARVQVEQDDSPVATRAGRPSGSLTDQTLDVAGSYRLSRNLDVTAGVRYSQDRSKDTALPDIKEQDSQAVYIGTQFRF